MNAQDTDRGLSWLSAWNGRAQGEWLALALDAFEPFTPLGAQLLYIMQPTMGWLLSRERLGALAQALETPEGVEAIRRVLREDADHGQPEA
jgi:hypothetical protein